MVDKEKFKKIQRRCSKNQICLEKKKLNISIFKSSFLGNFLKK